MSTLRVFVTTLMVGGFVLSGAVYAAPEATARLASTAIGDGMGVPCLTWEQFSERRLARDTE